MKSVSSPRLFSAGEILSVMMVGMMTSAWWAIKSGQDLGPDLVNYHFYNAWIVFHKDRLLSDVFPAGIQGYLNPYLYVLVYGLYHLLSPKGVGAVMGALHGLCLISAYLVCRALLAHWKPWQSRAMSFACASFGTVNPFFVGMLGSSFSDNLTPPLILVPLALVMMARFPASETSLPSRRYYSLLVCSGVLLGMSVGFKLCNCAFVFGMASAWMIRFRISKPFILGGLTLFGGVAAGFLLVSAEWMWRLYVQFGSPLFPFYNNIFKSPMIEHIDTNVPAWAAAHNLRDFFAYPYRWAQGIPPVSEWQFKDARFAVLYTLIGIVSVFSLLKHTKTFRFLTVRTDHPAWISNRWLFVAVWAAISWLFWIDQFGALRYLIPLTLLTGMLTLMCLLKMTFYRLPAIVIWMVLAVYALHTMEPVYFGRVKWKHAWYPVHIPEKLHTLKNVLYLKNSLSFMIPFMPADAHYISLGYLDLKGGLIRKGNDLLSHHQGPLRTLTLMPPDISFYDALSKRNLRIDPNDCVAFMAGVYPFMSCRVEKIQRGTPPMSMPLPQMLQFTEKLQPWLKSTTGFFYPENDGMWTAGDKAEINLLGVLPQRFRMSITASAVIAENAKLPFEIIVGSRKKRMRFHGGGQTETADFNLAGERVSKIVIKIPRPVSPHMLDPASGDTRLLGMMLKSIAITEAGKG